MLRFENGLKKLAIVMVLSVLAACGTTSDDGAVTEAQVETAVAPDMAAVPAPDVTSDILEPSYAAGSQQDLNAYAGGRVLFGYDRYNLNAEARSVLELQAQWMAQNLGASVTIEGHCDERGTREYNLALGDRRANATKNYLVALGVSASRINTISYGKERPAVLGTGDSSWAQNRRAMTVLN